MGSEQRIPRRRLVVLLGLGNERVSVEWRYHLARYRLPGEPVWPVDGAESAPLAIGAHVASAGSVSAALELVVLGSPQVREAWHDSGRLKRYLKRWSDPSSEYRFVEVPSGGGKNDAAAFVSLLGPLLEADEGLEAHLDVTHGFRAQSILASAAVEAAVNRALRDGRQPCLTVWYTAFEARHDNVVPVWDLTGLVTQHTWEMAIHNFVRHGRADAFAALCQDLGRRLLGTDYKNKEKQRKKKLVDKLAGAARTAADDLATVRTGSLLKKDAQSLVAAIDNGRDEVLTEAPTCKTALEELRLRFSELAVDNVQSPEGVRAMVRLARLAFDMHRFSECIALLREACVTHLGVASCPEAEPGPNASDGFKNHRYAMERAFGGLQGQASDEPFEQFVQALPELRNDVQHAAMREKPLSARAVRKQAEQRLRDLEGLLDIARA